MTVYPKFECKRCGFVGDEGDLEVAPAVTGHYGYCPECGAPCQPGHMERLFTTNPMEIEMAKGKVVRAMPAKSAAPNKKPYGGTNKNMKGKSC